MCSNSPSGVNEVTGDRLWPVLLLLAFLVGCRGVESVSLPTIPVPDATELLEYPEVLPADRAGDVISLRKDLTVGQASDDRAYLFATNVIAVDSSLHLYVLDYANTRVQMYDSQGQYVRTFGRAGQGPAEFEGGMALTVADKTIVVADVANQKIIRWKPDGTHLGDAAARLYNIGEISGLADGSFLVAHTVGREDLKVTHAYSRFDEDFEEELRYAEIATELVGGRVGERFLPVPMEGLTSPQAAVAETGALYVGAPGDYQVVAFGASGETRWSLRRVWPRIAFPRWLKERALERSHSFFRAMSEGLRLRSSRINWPQYLPAIRALRVDGRGNLYVFLQPAEPSRNGLVPVDVYSPDGEQLALGFAPAEAWDAARGQFVYRIEEDPQTGDDIVVRYELTLGR